MYLRTHEQSYGDSTPSIGPENSHMSYLKVLVFFLCIKHIHRGKSTSKYNHNTIVLTKILTSERSPLNSIFAFFTKDNSMSRLMANCTFSADMMENVQT